MSITDPLKKGATLEQLNKVKQYEDKKLEECDSKLKNLSLSINDTDGGLDITYTK